MQCKYCEKEREEAQMVMRAGKPSHMCLECKESRIGLASGAPKKKKNRRKREADAEDLRMMVPGGGYGFEAFVTDEDSLQISQANAGAESDNVVLTRHEGKQLVTMIGLWLQRPEPQ
jgi:hypothetical protein